MLMLSTLRRFELVDGGGRRARLDDFAVTLRAGAHPRVTRLVFLDAVGRSMTLPWEYVVEIDRRRRRFLIDNFEASQSADAAPAGEVLLRRDVLDALILDIENRRVMRANDLCLKEYDGKLLLWAADVGWRAILRRLSRGVFGAGPGASLLAAAVLPLATSYATCETFGLAKGVNLNYRRARSFFTLFTGLVVAGALAALIHNLPVIKLLVAVQALNGALLPVILFFIMRLINDERLTGPLRNTTTYNLLGWGTFALVTSAVAMMLGTQLLKMWGGL